ncbi:unnamed protein product [Macrosiphum euphorbiae]|uniref:Uncharacterized protein n=1 Tax=Macrosiphum euphorbiae TaxID=13131 RepID=A0AAV0X022_9HEMI|nr:unnamed protein product [Macrosiphum euphorbiae]
MPFRNDHSLPDYYITFHCDWRIGSAYSIYQPDKTVINELTQIINSYDTPKNPKSKVHQKSTSNRTRHGTTDQLVLATDLPYRRIKRKYEDDSPCSQPNMSFVITF